jgi:hypothetical protein
VNFGNFVPKNDSQDTFQKTGRFNAKSPKSQSRNGMNGPRSNSTEANEGNEAVKARNFLFPWPYDFATQDFAYSLPCSFYDSVKAAFLPSPFFCP